MDQSEPDDAKKWSIDRVVYEICQNDSPPWSATNAPTGAFLIPDRQGLEKIFRDNHIDGETLLDLTLEDLRSDLGVPSYGQRRAILKVIGFLRDKYVLNQKVNTYLQEGLATPDVTHSRRSPFGQSSAYSAFGIQPSVERHLADASPSFTPAAINHNRANSLVDSNASRPNPFPKNPPALPQNPFQQPFASLPIDQKYGTDQQLHVSTVDPTRPSSFSTVGRASIRNEQIGHDNEDVARGSRADNVAGHLDFLDDSINQTLNISDRLPSVGTRDQQPETSLGHQVTKKRIAPTWVSAPLEHTQDLPGTTFLHMTPKSRQEYLGPHAFRINDFLPNVSNTETRLTASNGFRSVVGRQMMEIYRRLPDMTMTP